MVMSFAAYLAFYSSHIRQRAEKGIVCSRSNGDLYTVSDDPWILDFYYEHKNDDEATLVHAVMKNERMWGMDLTTLPGFEAETVANLKMIRKEGVLAAFASCL